MLTIAEEFTLLAHAESDGKPLLPAERIGLLLAAALLAELAQNERIELDEDGGIRVIDRSRLGDGELDYALARLVELPHSCTPATWFGMLYSPRRCPRLLARLAERGVLTSERRGLLARERFPEAQPQIEQEVRERIAAALDGEWASGRTVALLALAHASGLAVRLFPGADVGRIEQLVNEDWVGTALAAYYRKDKGLVETFLEAVSPLLD